MTEISSAAGATGAPDHRARPADGVGAGATNRGRERRSWLARALVPIGLGFLVLAAVACEDQPGTTVTATVANDQLKVLGTNGPDAVTLRLQAGEANILQVDVGADGTADFQFDRATFSTIAVKGFGGSDAIVADHGNGAFADTEKTTLLGGDGADTLVGSFGDERLEGGAGDDLLDGNMGNDTAIGGDGADTFGWDPGDSSDTLTGGTGVDKLVFNGSNIGEVFETSNVGGHVRFTRDIAAVTMDLDEIEAMDLRALGGADTLRAGDLTGTDLATLTTDFGASGGGDDAALDQVVVAPGVALGHDGAAATVGGVGAQVRVANGTTPDQIHVVGSAGSDVQPVAGTPGADAVSVTANGTDVAVFGTTGSIFVNLTTVEKLDVDLGGGDDSFSTAGNLATLTALDVDGGDGADTILGGNGIDVLAGGPGADFIDGQQGTDTANGGDGDDVLQWDPGDASDTLVGGPGADRLVFNGANIAEVFETSNVGGHVRFTRDIATVTLDLDEVEAMDVRSFGGADLLRAGDLTGTDLATLTADFAASLGGDDGAVDEVVVAPGATISQDAGVATVAGLGAQVRVVNGAATDRIHVTGTAGADVVPVVGTAGADTVSAIANGTDVAVFGATGSIYLDLTTVEKLDVDLAGGGDTFNATGNLAALVAVQVDGGDGADTIQGSNGIDVLDGGLGDDFIDGQQGNDTADGGDGADTFQWDPGDGLDTLVGGIGADKLVFNGSNIAETFEVSNVGGHVRFTRDIAAIVLDLDQIESMDVRSFGGADRLTVQDLKGTALTALTTDLALFGGAADGVLDQVVVNGTNGADQISVVDDGAAVVVNGLAATVRITGADQLLDLLSVNGLGGNDTIAATPGAGALIQLSLTP